MKQCLISAIMLAGVLSLGQTRQETGTKVIAKVLNRETQERLDLQPGTDLFLEVEYRTKPNGKPLFFEEAEKLWWVGQKALIMFGSTGPALPQAITDRAMCWVEVTLDGETVYEGVLMPRRDGFAVSDTPSIIAEKLSVAVTMDVKYLAKVANYLAGNVSAVHVTASSYSIDGVGEVIDSSGTWTGNPIAGSSPWTDTGTNVSVLNRQVGIGTDSPNYDFEIFNEADDTRLFYESGQMTVSSPNVSGQFTLEGKDGGRIRFKALDTSRTGHIMYDSSNNLILQNEFGNIGLVARDDQIQMMADFVRLSCDAFGMGTSTPEAYFHIKKIDDTSDLMVDSQFGDARLLIDSGSNKKSEIRFSTDNTERALLGFCPNHNRFYWQQPDNTPIGFTTGNFGIGTLTPETQLHVTRDTGTVEQLVRSVDNEAYVNIDAGPGALSDLGFYTDGTRNASIGYSPAKDQLYFQNFNDGSTYFHTNTFGIGTNSPSTKLHIYESNTDAVAKIEAHNDTAFLHLDSHNGVSAIEFQKDGAFKGSFGFSHNNEYLFWYHGGHNVVWKNGKMGVGTTNPLGTLDIDGSIYQRGSQLHADYVFQDEYEIEGIAEHAEFMWREKHLPAVPPARVDEQGREIVEVGQHQRGILEELEKAHIYIQQLHKEIQKLNQVHKIERID